MRTEYAFVMDFLHAFFGEMYRPEERPTLDEGFRRYCAEQGVPCTDERLAFLRDVRAVIEESPGDEDVSLEEMADGLERHGWNLEYGCRPVVCNS